MMRRGVDVSTHNGAVDWNRIKDDGIDFAMIKATQGRSVTGTYRDFTDSKFTANITGAATVGLDVGVYHYLTAQTVTEAMAEAEYFLSVIYPYKNKITMYAAVDVEEDKYLPKDKKLLTQIVNTFCSRVYSAGFDPIVYTNPDYLEHRLTNVSAWPLWLALWRNKNNVPAVEQYPNLRIWQWGTETVPGILGRIDANLEVTEKPKPKTEESTMAKEKDNTPDTWAKEAVEWAKNNQIITGDGSGDLRLHDTLTRQEMCVMLHRASKRIASSVADEIAQKLAEALQK
jgi:GH25 family lysozyme M1 (1,4-beta-N-acetylmuramidase)